MLVSWICKSLILPSLASWYGLPLGAPCAFRHLGLFQSAFRALYGNSTEKTVANGGGRLALAFSLSLQDVQDYRDLILGAVELFAAGFPQTREGRRSPGRPRTLCETTCAGASRLRRICNGATISCRHDGSTTWEPASAMRAKSSTTAASQSDGRQSRE